MTTNKRSPSLFEALIPILCLVVLLTINVFVFDDTLAGANQAALLLAATIGGIIVQRQGMGWSHTSDQIIKTIGSAMPSMLILLLIGSLAGTWMISGIVPAMIYYGMDLVNPHVFLVTAVIVCSVVSVATGSSWSTIATIGVALLGIGKTMGIDDPIVAGAIISGAYFGDKISPLSDTTNLAPAMAGTDIFTHIRYMFYTTIPSMGLTLIIFIVLGFKTDFSTSIVETTAVKNAINNAFNITPWLFIVPIILLTLILKKVPAIPSLMAGTLLGGVFAVIFQPDIIKETGGEGISYLKASYISIMQAIFGDTTIDTSHSSINELLSTSGMRGMLNTVWLILSAMVFGGVMEAGGLLTRITRPIMMRARSSGALVSSTVGTCLFFNATASDQYIAIVVPGRMFKKAYEEMNLKPEVLSRTLEDSGTMTSVLIPWNTCGATQSRILGVATLDYVPYCFFNIISPFISILFAYLNIKIRRIEPITKHKTHN
ncbi:Na+/H+ antiporter NhaC [Thermophagus xiamenensis]|uniref:Transporter, NhaC family n=1 Tax=Thermophagus xiamenensis TaxID=385682 RepID=A0A1I2DU47_9BACT|nr:Na+/H+ antiporter NhaC [Thermophagus xiamenensis]SFE83938.1 transporter, NhaC family [Thermophagus xiamenensis]